jgi:hypothetical protein
MAEQKGRWAWVIVSLVVLVLLLGAAVASLLLTYLGDWENHAVGLTLARRIIWGTWVLAVFAVILTRVTVLGWSLRSYFRWDDADEPPPPGAPRPTKAPWYKSAAASFGFTVALVSLTGSVVVVTAVLYTLAGVTIPWDVFWLVVKILWASWWVLSIVLVVIRVAVFGIQRRSALQATEQMENKS